MSAAFEASMGENDSVAVEGVSVHHEAGQDTTIPLNQLFLSQENVRTKHDPETIRSLAATIKAEGLLSPLAVIPEKRTGTGKGARREGWGVVAGGRRLAALELLAAEGHIAKDAPIAVRIYDASRAKSVSLTENVTQEAMHPADQLVAFKALAEQGKTAAQIASTFGVSELTVQRRLALANLAPMFVDLYRENKIDPDQLRALALTADHAKQVDVWNGAHRPSAYTIRKLLTEAELSGKDKHVRFVGRAAYEAAGGAVRVDLFGDEDDFYVQDVALIHRLSSEKLQAIAVAQQSWGWKWIEVRDDFGYAEKSRFHQLHPKTRKPTPEEARVIAQLDANLEALRKALAAIEAEASDQDRDYTDEETSLLGELETQIGSLEDLRESAEATRRSYGPKQMASSGVVLTLGHDGQLVFHEGLVRPADRKEATRSAAGEGAGADDDAGAGEDAAQPMSLGRGTKGEFSQALMFNMTAHRTAATAAALIGNPKVAMVALVHALHSKHARAYATSPVCMSMHDKTSRVAELAKGLDGTPAAQAMADAEAAWGGQLPDSSAALFAHLLTLDMTQLAELLAFHVARSYDVMSDRERTAGEPVEVAAAVEAALALNMSEWWTPTAETYLAGVSNAKRIEAVTQACGEAEARPLEKMKKDDAIAFCAAKLEGTGWLPSPLKSRAAQAD